jgi:hypothetical protein
LLAFIALMAIMIVGLFALLGQRVGGAFAPVNERGI